MEIKDKLSSLGKLVLIPILAWTLSCQEDNQFKKYKEKGDYVIIIWNNGNENHFSMKIKDESKSFLHSLDYCVNGKSDGAFDEITLKAVPKENPLREYANLDSINKLYQEVKETGYDFPWGKKSMYE